MSIRSLSPAEIERESFEIITKELGDRIPDPEQAPVIKRVIHTTADFSYADTLFFSPDAVRLAKEAIQGGAMIVTDTQMGLAGINKRAAEKFGCKTLCFMSDADVAAEARRRGVTRALVSMEKAAALGENVIFAIGNAPTALIRLRELIDNGYRPRLVIGVPVGFVNVAVSKERIMETDVPCIVARGRKGGSNVAACIVNALLYMLDESRGVGNLSTRFAETAGTAGIAPVYPTPESGFSADTPKDPYAVLAAWNAAIAPPDEAAARAAKAHWDGIAKPLDGLGKLETAIIRIAALTGNAAVTIEKRAVAVLCADNGVVVEGVTQCDASVTATMAAMIAEHRSSVCLMAKTVRADVFCVDMGMLHRVDGVWDMHVGNGTANMTQGPAMSADQALQALENGVTLAKSLAAAGYRILVTGEMGIGNTTTSSAVTAVLLGLSVEAVTGRGAGLSDEGLERKRAAICTAIRRNQPEPSDAFDVLQKIGGFDLAGLAGLYIGAALCRIPVLIDGFPSSAAALLAARLVPNCRIAMLPSHCSAESAAQAVLQELGLEALLFADMKLGEGTGAVCMLPLLDAALAVYHGSASFRDTGIEQYQPQGGTAL